MDISPWALAKFIVPRIPQILQLMITNRLGWSPNSDKQDPRTEIVVTMIRESLKFSRPLGEIQSGFMRDPGIKGPMWIATATCPAPENNIRELVLQGVKEVGDGKETFDLPDTADVQGEWTGHRAGVNAKASRPNLGSERAHYDQLMSEVTSDVVVLYFHGGAYFLMDPISHRVLNASLAKRTGGRTFSVRYRLAPQTAFPGQLIDALTAYLYLQAPTGDAFHKPILAKNIVFAGDSAGGHLAFSLMLLILTLRRAGVKSIKFHGKDVPLELPAALAGNSPWVDMVRSLPSINTNAKYDYIEPPSATGLPHREVPEDDVWPTKPPRAELFCTASTTLNPLCSPIQATSEMWQGAPPVFMCLGNEGLEDEITVIARKLYLGGVSVDFVGYEGQPHCFGMIFPTSLAGKDCLDKWADFISRAVAGRVKRTDEGSWAIAKSQPIQWRSVKLAEIGVSDDLVQQRTMEMKRHAITRETERLIEYEKSGGGRAKL